MFKDSKSRKFIIIGGIILSVILIGVIIFLSLNTEENSADTNVDVATTFPADPILEDINIIDTEENTTQDPLSIVDQNNSVQIDYSDPIVTSDFIQDDITEDTSSSDEDLAFLTNYKETHQNEDYYVTETGEIVESEDLLQKRLDEMLNNPTMGMSEDMIAFLGEDFIFPQSGEDVLDNALNGVASSENVDQWVEQTQAEGLVEAGIYEGVSTDYDSCGSISIDVDEGSSEQGIISELSDDASAICVADRILNDCESARVNYGGYTYLIDLVDGNVCSVGKMVSGFTNMCAINQDLDSLSLDASNREKAALIYDIFVNQDVSNCIVYKN